MTVQEALNFFGLDSNFTHEDLRKVYWNLAKKYHPDDFEKSSSSQVDEEEMKKINIAKDTLDRWLKSGKKVCHEKQQSNLDIKKYKADLILKLSKYNSSNVTNDELVYYHNKICLIIDAFRHCVQDCLSKDSIDNFYNLCKQRIFKHFDQLKIEVFQQHDVDESDVRETISYECNLEEFYRQLLQLAKKYNKKNIYQERLNRDLQEYHYELRSGYDEIKEFVAIVINNALIRLKKNHYTNYDEELKKVITEIDNLFYQYFDYVSQFNQILKFFSHYSLKDVEIKKIFGLYVKYLASFKDGESFLDTERHLERLKGLMEKIKEQELLSENFKELDNCLKIITKNYQSVIQTFSYPKDLSVAQMASNHLNEVFRLAEQVKNGTLSMEVFEQLVNLTFLNSNQDGKLLDKVRGTSSRSHIFVLNHSYSNSDDLILVKLIDQSRGIVTIQGIPVFNYFFKVDTRILNEREFKESYVSLEKTLEDCIFSGYQDLRFPSKVRLYYNDFISIIYDKKKNQIQISPNSNVSIYCRYWIGSDLFKNINYTVEKIDEMLTQKIMDFEKKEKSNVKAKYL